MGNLSFILRSGGNEMAWSTHRSVQQMHINEPSSVKLFPLLTFDIILLISRTPSGFESKHSAFKSGMWGLIALVRLIWLTVLWLCAKTWIIYVFSSKHIVLLSKSIGTTLKARSLVNEVVINWRQRLSYGRWSTNCKWICHIALKKLAARLRSTSDSQGIVGYFVYLTSSYWLWWYIYRDNF